MGFLPHLISLLKKHGLGEERLFEGQGCYSRVRVVRRGGKIELITGRDFRQSSYVPNQSPLGTVFDWYLAAPFFSGGFAGNLKRMLVLGLGGGGAAKLYNSTFRVEKIIGVEIDPLIIELGEKYFGLTDPNLVTVNDDAVHYLENTSGLFDIIILDAFRENVFEAACASFEFLKKARTRLAPGGVLLVNRVLGDETNNRFSAVLRRIFPTIFSLKVHRNLFYLATSSPTAPKNREAASQLLFAASRSYPSLKFLRTVNPSDIQRIFPEEVGSRAQLLH